jgi:hypothetical protein
LPAAAEFTGQTDSPTEERGFELLGPALKERPFRRAPYGFLREPIELGSILYQALAVTFMAEAYNVALGWPELLTILITVLIASKGGANIPSGSLVILATVLTAIGLPVEAIALVAGVDAFMDMGRTAVNVLGNTVATKLGAGVTAVIFMCVFGFQSGRKTTRCGRARARSVAVIVRAWLRTPTDYSKLGPMTGRWWRITASEPAPAIF